MVRAANKTQLKQLAVDSAAKGHPTEPYAYALVQWCRTLPSEQQALVPEWLDSVHAALEGTAGHAWFGDVLIQLKIRLDLPL
jgi:hypothetical protein